MIDLRSDTVTKPTQGMLDAVLSASVGDDVFGDDPTVIKLQNMISDMFGMESAIYCPSGTMTNQIAINAHTNPGDEIICDRMSHIYNYEGGGIARNSGVSTRLLNGNRGRFKASDVAKNINPDDEHFPITSLVSIENTCNKGGGSIWNFEDIKEIAEVCKKHKLKLHLDGARLFNALIETNESPKDYGNVFDSISICLSKGLGAPIGSILLGSKEFINRARRVRKVFGGGMRQVGYLAAAGIFALENNTIRLKEDHKRAKTIENTLKSLPYVKSILPVDTNLMVFELEENMNANHFLKKLEENKILAIKTGHQLIRMVTHLDFNDDMLKTTVDTLNNINL
ncbi:MAG: aminotransferase class I/II-fold pyridoxal phosphate-dependent enzyme [Planctomycetia bacterium]|nr:aminotransferase class I/II-fold pyridoxal phosphate-dependent enzyme [Planctomycetia bacterium]